VTRITLDTPRIAWSLTYLGIASSLIGVMGALGPGFATQILRLRAEDFFFIMGPAGLGAVIGILFLNGYGRTIPRRLLIDVGLVAMGITLMAIAAVKPVSELVSPAVRPLESNLPELLSPFVSVIAVVVVIGELVPSTGAAVLALAPAPLIAACRAIERGRGRCLLLGLSAAAVTLALLSVLGQHPAAARFVAPVLLGIVALGSLTGLTAVTALLGQGAIDLAAEPIVNPWDVAAVQVLVQQAGGRFTDLDGVARYDGGTALSSNGLLHDAALTLLQQP